mmetsp:Transcript_31317/g.82981  ORF Transcript_31317/g.82981 Transcript_31317/m.82981 type:complete len:395 (-) Transcript_31317:8-1192(-)
MAREDQDGLNDVGSPADGPDFEERLDGVAVNRRLSDVITAVGCRARHALRQVQGSGAKAAKVLKTFSLSSEESALRSPGLAADDANGAERQRRLSTSTTSDSMNSEPCSSLARGPTLRRSSSAPTSGEDVATPLIIFDWDDTLFPTTHLTEVVLPGSSVSTQHTRLPEDSPFAKALDEHGRLVNDVLVAACSVASVCIVTLSARPWVEDSARWFLPNSGVAELVRDLGIPVYYAREHVKRRDKFAAHVEEGVDLFMIAKRNAMKHGIQKFSRKKSMRCKRRNIISIGDSVTEENAVKEILWEDDFTEDLCKTVRFIADPTLDVLGRELQLLRSWLDKIVYHGHDLHAVLENAETMGDVFQTLLGEDYALASEGDAHDAAAAQDCPEPAACSSRI